MSPGGEAFEDLTTWVSVDSIDDLPSRIVPVTPEPLPFRLGRYQATELVGAGGMGAVYRAIPDGGTSPVALKVLVRMSAKALFGFKQEFRRTASLSHPNLIQLYELGIDEGTWYFSMELVDGAQFHHRAWGSHRYSGASKACDGVLALLPQLLDGVEELHRNDVLHLDIKPPNVLATRDGIVKIVDFGISETEDAAKRGDRGFAGTPAYMAPEQVWGTRTKYCDYYAMGVTLFQAVVGHLPYWGPPSSALLAKRTQPAPRVETLVQGVPERLSTLINALLEREPHERPDPDEARKLLGFPRTRRDAPMLVVPSAELVGREPLLAELRELLERCSEGSILAKLEGDSGVGKSTLLRAAIQAWRQAGALVLSSRCFQWQAISFKAADALVDQLYQFSESCSKLQTAFSPDLGLAIRMFPVLAGLTLDTLPERPADPHEEKARALGAVGELVASIAGLRRVVVCIDDAQWGDVESAEVVASLLDACPKGLLVVLGMRKPEGPPATFPEFVTRSAKGFELVELQVAPLSFADSVRLARSLAGDDTWSPSQLDAIASDAAGVPIFIEQVARFRHVVSGRPPKMTEVVRANYTELCTDERMLLDMVVVAQRPTPLSYVLSAVGELAGLHGALATLQSLCLVRSEGLDEAAMIEPYHDRVRTAVMAELGDDDKKRLNARFASELQSRDAAPGWIAEHLYAAGEARRAADFTLVAAAVAYEALAFARAADLYARALEWHPAIVRQTAPVLERYAWALYRAGRCRQAGLWFGRAAERATGERRHELMGHAVEALLVAGEVDRGAEQVQRLLTEMSIPRLARGPWVFVQLLCLLFMVRWKTRQRLPHQAVDPVALRRANVTWDAGKALTNLLPLDGIVLLLRSLLFSIQSHDEPTIARGLAIAASGYVPFMEGRSRALLDAVTQIVRRHPSAYLEGLLGVVRMTDAHMSGEWSRILALAEPTEQNLQNAHVPVHWERSLFDTNCTVGYEHLGLVLRGAEFSLSRAKAAKRRGDLVAYISTLCHYAHCLAIMNDTSALDETISEIGSIIATWTAGYGVWHCTLWRLQVMRAMRHDDFAGAQRLLDENWPKVRGALLLHTRGLRSLALETRAAVLLNAPHLAGTRRTHVERSLAAVIRALRKTDRLDAPPAVEALNAARAHRRGNDGLARQHLERALKLYQAAGMRERACIVAWRLAVLAGDDAERRTREHTASEMGIRDIANWARFRAPGLE